MAKRFVSIWFRHLMTDWSVRHQPDLKDIPFVLAAPERGRMVVQSACPTAQAKGINAGMVVADCRSILPTLKVLGDKPEQKEKLLTSFAEWCIRYTPIAAIDLPDGLILDVSGCTHLWGGEHGYLKEIISKLSGFGYNVRVSIADTIGTAWANARFGKKTAIIESGEQMEALLYLPPAALRLEPGTLARMEKLGLYEIQSFITMPRTALRRRFGQELLTRLDQALGAQIEPIEPVCPVEPYQERLPAMEGIRTAKGIEIALRKLLETLCTRLLQEGKGLRKSIFKGFRADGITEQIEIGTNKPSRNVEHLFKLFELNISTMTPGLGFELFILEAPIVEDVSIEQNVLWHTLSKSNDELGELLDRVAAKVGSNTIHRYLPDEHYWPERSIKLAASFQEKATVAWRNIQRPIRLLAKPETIEVSVPMPDYPPMLFIYKGQIHNVRKADGPERIEIEWWLDSGLHRDYYSVEDEQGARYWLFRLGHYGTNEPKWFIHGFFA